MLQVLHCMILSKPFLRKVEAHTKTEPEKSSTTQPPSSAQGGDHHKRYCQRKMSSTGIAIGLKKGYPVEKREKVARPANSKGVSRIAILRKLIRLN